MTRAASLGAAVALAYYLPSALLLRSFLRGGPATLGSPSAAGPPWCRWRVAGPRDALALTFDDGPSPHTTERTLDLLGALGLRATFFVIGREALAHRSLVAEMVDRGHEVALHGFEHRHHLRASPRWIFSDLARAVEVHDELLGAAPRFFRPPYGQLCAATLAAARREQVELVLWSRWGKEFADHDPASVLARLEPGVGAGAVLLLHDTDVLCPPGTARCTHEVLRPLAEILARRDLQALPLGELLDRARGPAPSGTPAGPHPRRPVAVGRPRP